MNRFLVPFFLVAASFLFAPIAAQADVGSNDGADLAIWLAPPTPVYATTIGNTTDGKLTLVYNPLTGDMSVEGPLGEQYKNITIQSASGMFNVGVAQWLSPPLLPGATNGTSNTPVTQGYVTTTGSGGTFLASNGFDIGLILPSGKSFAQLLADLTITYGIQGQVGTKTGNLIPEPSSVVLLSLGLVGLSIGSLVRPRRTAKA